MRSVLTLILIFIFYCSHSQVFQGTGGPIQNTGNETFFFLNVGGLPSQLDNNFGIEEVNIDISHASVEELNVYLKSPSGTIVELTNGANCKGSNYTGTKFRSDFNTSISVGTAPYTGNFKPTGYLGRFNTGQAANGNWTLIVKDWLFGGNSGTLNSWSIKFGNSAPDPVVLTSSNLPIVIINTNNQTINDLNSVVVDLGIIANVGTRNNINDPRNNYNGKAAIHIRGSSSKIFEKKSFKIELKDASGVNDVDAPLLWMPAESDWILTASYSDKSLLRNSLIHHMAHQIGRYSPRSKMVEVVINGEYMGVYTFIEQPKRGPARVNISGLGPMDNNFPNITGGYIIQINRADKPGWYSLLPGISVANPPGKFYYQYNYPNELEITQPQKDYIKSVMDTFETVMNSPNFADPAKGYRRYIDAGSFVDFLLLNEFSKNSDGYKLSTYLYKDDYIAGGRLHAGPMWDYDIAFHNCNFGNAFSELYWQYDQPAVEEPIPTWWKRFMEDGYFKDLLYCHWHTHRRQALSNAALFSYIDQNAAELNEAQQRNFQQFPILGAYIYPNPQVQNGATYQTEVTDLKNWIAARAAWLDANIPGYCNNVGIAENKGENNTLLSFPNPFSSSLNVTYATKGDTDVRIELIDPLGNLILKGFQGRKAEGVNTEVLNTEGLIPGSYILAVYLNHEVYHKKLIKLQ